jgi:hypothetical protein
VGLAYNGKAPDLGAFETTGSTLVIRISSIDNNGNSPGASLTRIERRAGISYIINGAGSLAIVKVVDISGKQIIDDITMEAGKTASLPDAHGIVLVKIVSNGKTQITRVNQLQ